MLADCADIDCLLLRWRHKRDTVSPSYGHQIQENISNGSLSTTSQFCFESDGERSALVLIANATFIPGLTIHFLQALCFAPRYDQWRGMRLLNIF